jgi:amino acid adenylation domain-containing protein
LNAADLQKKLLLLGVEENGRADAGVPSDAPSATIRTALASQEAQLLDLLDDRSLSLRAGLGDLPGGRVALSWGQRRLWLLNQIDGPSAAFNIPLVLRLRGPFDTAALAAACAELVARHAPLRTIVETVEDVPFGRLMPPPAPQVLLAREDLSSLQAEEQGRELSARYASEAARAFDLASEYLLRARLVRLGDEDHVLILVIHHAAADGVSLAVLLGELASAYGAFSCGIAPNLPALPIQYADYAAWQQSRLEQGGELAGQLGYWREQLAGVPHFHTLPTDRPRDPDRSRKAAYLPLRLEPDLARQLDVLARRHGVTTFAVILAGYAGLLGRLAGQEEIVIGTPIAGRNRIETENLVGFFVNMLPLRVSLAGNPDAATLIARARDTVLDGFDNQDLPFERLLQELALPRSRAHTPLFQVALAWQSQGSPSFNIPGLTTETLFLALPQAKYDLTLGLIPQQDGSYAGNFEYDASLFDEATIIRWRAYLVRTFEGMVASASLNTPLSTRSVTTLPILDAVERKLVLETFNDTAAPLPENDLAALFEAQVTVTPGAIALVGEDGQFTYADLDAAANRLAHHLIARRIGPESLIGIALDRSHEMVIVLLAILKAGAAYLPLDPEYPTQRIQFMLSDSDARLLLTTSKIAKRLKLTGEDSNDADMVPLLFIDDASVKADLATRPATAPTNADRTTHLNPTNLAYVIYTSGSTGQPKGVATTHANVVALAWRPKYAPLHAGQTVLQLAPVSFDAATFEIWGALLNGARLVLAPSGRLDLDRIAHTISRYEVDTLWLTAGLFRQVVETHPHLLAGVKRLLAGGDVLPMASVRRVRAIYPALTLINGYGPTETTTFACTRLITSKDLDAERIPIGSPISNTRVYVLDDDLSPVPIGIAGELYISGAGLARGYLNRPDLTAERFVRCPFGSPGERMYRTGDIARWLPDGTLDFTGRADNQVKIRGFRIEPGEIETVLVGIDGIAQAVVTPREIAGDTRLVAYLVARPGLAIPPVGELRAGLAARLPDYMIPAAFVSIDALPLTVNGKLDRDLLPMPARTGPEATAPLTMTERRLAKIWKDILGLDEVDRADDFFELGGHSLLALRLIAAVEAEFGRRIGLATFFESSTIESFALAVERWDERQFDFRKVVRLYPESTRPQIFGINNTGAYYHLAKKLGPEWPLTSLQLFDPSSPPDCMPESVEQIAAQYVQMIRELQPNGPYRLLSWCAGGILTLEVARQLLAANEEVPFLAVIEAYAPVQYKRFGRLRSVLAANSFRLKWNFAELKKVVAGKQSLTRFLLYRQSLQVAAGIFKWFRGSRPKTAEADYELWLMTEYLASLEGRYQLATFPGRIHLFRASAMPKGLFLDDLNGWGAYAAGGVELAFIEGDHHSIFRPPGLDQMAEKIAAALVSAG